MNRNSAKQAHRAETQLRSRHAPRDEPNVSRCLVEKSSADRRLMKQPAHHAERDGYVNSRRNNISIAVYDLRSLRCAHRVVT